MPRCLSRFSYQSEIGYGLCQRYVDLSGILNGLSQSYTTGSNPLFSIWAKCDGYFYKLILRIQTARDSFLSFNRDLSDTESGKGLSFIEHLFHILVNQRENIGRILSEFQMESLEQLRDLFETLTQQPMSDVFLIDGGSIASHVSEAKNVLDSVLSHLVRICMIIQIYSQKHSKYTPILDCLESWKVSLESLKFVTDKYYSYYTKDGNSSIKISSLEFVETMQSLSFHLQDLKRDILKFSHDNTQISHVLSQLNRYLSNAPLQNLCIDTSLNVDLSLQNVTPDQSKSVIDSAEASVEKLLIAFQDLNYAPDEKAHDVDEFNLRPSHIIETHDFFIKMFRPNRLPDILQSLAHLHTLATSKDNDSLCFEYRRYCISLIAKIYPLLDQYLSLFHNRVAGMLCFPKDFISHY
jgi:hypothetical protein